MQVKIKKLHKDAVIPKKAHEQDAGLDLVATSVVDKIENLVYGTGLAFEIPEGHVGLLFPRSSVYKKDLVLANSIGVLDSNFRGEVKLIFKKQFVPSYFGQTENPIFNIGDRIGQLIIMPYPQVELIEVDELSDTERGSNGWGSTGR